MAWKFLYLASGVFLIALGVCSAGPVPPGMARVSGGTYGPAFRSGKEPKEISVKAFVLDVLLVTNGDFLEFARANPQWQRSRVNSRVAEQSYLKHWAGDLELGSNAPANVPVTFVSWYAARAYAEWRHKRLPTVAEWEYAASASSTRPDGRNDPTFSRQVLAWYTSPARAVSAVGQGLPNFWGIHDLHGLVWEWVLDFNRVKPAGGDTADQFCGAGAQEATDRGDFPAFLRFGLRSSLKANYTVHNLGFRCASDLEE
jgi:formylglycine-generating enzyme required for sulfatase activity